MINSYAAMEIGGELEPYQYDPGELGYDEVEIDVHSCGICHSDISIIDNAWGTWGEDGKPVVPGHEVAGTVAKVGENVNNLKVGEKVGLGWHSGYCKQCNSCKTSDYNLCSSSQPTIIGHYGGFADKVRAEAISVVPIPDGLDLLYTGPLFCAGVTVFNPLVQYNIKPTDKVGIIGIGGLGHLALQFLKAWGCEVTAFTSSDSKRESLMELGVHHVLNSMNAKDLGAAAGRFDLIISTVNVKLDWDMYLSTLASRGRLHFVGATLEPLNINVFSLISAQRSVSGSPVGSPVVIAKMLEFADLHDIKPIIEVFKFTEVNKAIKRLRKGDLHYRAVLTN